MAAAAKTPNVKTDILKSVLTWGHVITLSVILLAAVMNVGGLIAILCAKDIAGPITAYIETWQTFYIVGIAGYDAKTTVENALKISKSIRELKAQTGGKAETDAAGSNG